MCGVARHARACYGGRLWPRRLASRMREVSTTPRASKYLRCSTLLSHVAAAAVPHAADAATPRATRDAGRAARDESRDSIFACGATSVGGRHYERTAVVASVRLASDEQPLAFACPRSRRLETRLISSL
jgi:hypothetical protein